MPSPCPQERIAFLPRPGPTVRKALRPPDYHPHPDPSVPQLFTDALIVRMEVFSNEQNCSPIEEVDSNDPISFHWILFSLSSSGDESPVATIRLVPAQLHIHAHDVKAVGEPDYKNSKLWDRKEPYVMIGRVATLKEFRGKGYGKVLVEMAVEWSGAHGGEVVEDKEMGVWKGLILAHAQMDVRGWYEKLGFEWDRGMGTWWEEGIQHVAVWKRVRATG